MALHWPTSWIRQACRHLMLVAFALAWTSGPQLLAAELPRLRPDGGYLVDESGQKVPLKGCNLGTWLLIEPWMLGVSSQYEDQCSFLAKLQSRFGNDCAGQLMNVYRDNWIGRREVELIRSFGFNLVRLPFHYSLLTDDAKPLVLRRDAFAWLDRAVNLAEESGLYIILDMHGVPGGQSIDMPTGCRGINALWSDPANQQRTAWLWQQIAARYRTRAAVVAYDIINEPYGDFRSDIRPQLLDIVNQVHTSIRQVDPDKLIFAPSPIHGIEFYGEPRGHGWTNVGFTEHFYPGIFDGVAPTLETHGRFLATTVGAKRLYVEGLAVPYLVGEFNVVYDRLARPEWMRRYYDEYAAAGWLSSCLMRVTCWPRRRLTASPARAPAWPPRCRQTGCRTGPSRSRRAVPFPIRRSIGIAGASGSTANKAGRQAATAIACSDTRGCSRRKGCDFWRDKRLSGNSRADGTARPACADH